MASSSVHPQAPGLRQRASAYPWRLLTPTGTRPDQRRADNIARRRNETACPHPHPCYPAVVAPSPTSAEDRNPHSHRLWPAGSFLGDFRTPAGARNSSRLRNGRGGVESGTAASIWHWTKRPFGVAEIARVGPILHLAFCDGNSSENSTPPILTRRSGITRQGKVSVWVNAAMETGPFQLGSTACPASKGHSQPKSNDEDARNTLLPKSHARPLHDPRAHRAGRKGIGAQHQNARHLLRCTE
jgi:hypothetical protein